MKLKKIMMLVLVAFLAVALAACSGGQSGSGSESAGGESTGGSGNAGGSSENGSEGEGEITLQMAWWGSQARHDRTIEVIEMYEEQNPHINIEYEFTSYDGYWEKMAARAAGNNLPDIMQQNFGEYLTQYHTQGLLHDMNEFLEDGTIDSTHIDDSIFDSGSLDGQLLGISLGTNAYTVIYDPALHEEAGIDEPSQDWTWEDYVNNSKAIAQVTDYGSSNLDSTRMFEIYLRQHGYKLFSDDGTDLGYDDDQLFNDYISMKKDMLDAGAAPPLDVALEHDALENQLVVHGMAGYHILWSNQIVAANEAAGRELDIQVIPGPHEGMYLKPSQFFSIPASSQYKEEAAKFINFFVNDIEANKILNSERGVPISSEVRDALREDMDEVGQKMFDYIDTVTGLAGPIDKNTPPAAAEVLALIDEVDEKVLYDQITPEEAATELREGAREILNR